MGILKIYLASLKITRSGILHFFSGKARAASSAMSKLYIYRLDDYHCGRDSNPSTDCAAVPTEHMWLPGITVTFNIVSLQNDVQLATKSTSF